MKTLLLLLILISLTVLTSCESEVEKNSSQDNLEEITFITKDSIKIYGQLYRVNKSNPTILLFHQARSNARGEYGEIIPRLTQSGYNVLAIDQRRGGQIYGNYNRTILDFEVNNYSYCDAYPDLDGALDYVINAGYSGDKFVWGSSYSAALAIILANNRSEDISGVLAFSPASGGPMEDCNPNEVFAELEVPMLLLRPSSEMEFESVQSQYRLAIENGHTVYTAENGVHGSSMLDKDRSEADIERIWEVINKFIHKQVNVDTVM